MPASNYIYPSAKIRALEPKILDQTDIERMVDAPDFDNAFKVLNDTDYADNLLEVEPFEFRKALTNDFKQLYDLLGKITPDKRLFQLLFLERDLVNLKLLFKAKHFEQNVDDLVEEDTVYPISHFKKYIFEQKDIGLDKGLKNLISEAEKQIFEDTRPDQIDAILTREYFKLIQNIANKLRNAFIKKLIKIKINNANIITFLRAKKLNLAKNQLLEKLIKGGTI
ncbi:MAG: V-type ATPase subunit, partial [Patescibacteria group bacterium]|nr:V-type ATPase subunit [Patescibacteria group bacterium]